MKHWSWISGLIKRAEVHPAVITSWGWLQYCVCIGINIAWSSWHNLAGLLSNITPQHHGNMYADGYWIQIRARPDIQQLLLQFSGRKSGWPHKHTHTDNWTHTCTCLSSFWAVFQCAISSAERPQSCLWNLAFMTAWSVPYSNYRWQHTRTHSNLHAQTHTHIHTQTRRKSSVCTKLNIGGLLHTLRYSHTHKHIGM